MPGEPAPHPDKFSAAIGEFKKLGWRVGLPALITLVLPALGGFVLVGAAIPIRHHVEAFGAAGALVFAVAYALTTGLALMPTYALSFASGVFFGFEKGGVIAMPSIVVGAMIGYVVAAVLARARTSAAIEEHPKARIVRDALIGRSFFRTVLLVTLLRLPPNSPFALTNLVMSSVRVNPLAYFIGTAVGIAPRTLFVVWIGAQAKELSEKTLQESWGMKIATIGIGLVVMVLVMALIVRWSRAALEREMRRDKPAPQTP